ncbi:hypothetical protein [Novosphingobium aquae]|uniref:Uncharacterized protein n=1 Tax=Novosphingobium aquae TaxID=3133435 RepID=A0ABU8S6Z7_9SPHN
MSVQASALSRDFAIAAIGLFLITRLIAFLSGTPPFALTWQDVALPLGAAAIFVFFRNFRGGRPQ